VTIVGLRTAPARPGTASARPYLRLPRAALRHLSATAARGALALLALAIGLEPLLPTALGSHAPAWSHWWCSASASTGPHTAARSGLGGVLHATLAVLAVHWPHFLPIPAALATLVYLRRADAAWRAGNHHP
jgi:hypothetical protein